MIAHLTGMVLEAEEKALVVDVHGIGYRVAVLAAVRDGVQQNETVALHIYHQVSDDAENLYGFTSRVDMKFFELLLTVPSVGPRTAMNILNVAPPRVLAQAVADEDIGLLTRVSGVGKKTAERILVELKEKIGRHEGHGAAGTVQHETVEALMSIGFTPAQARSAVAQLPREVATVEAAVRAALKTRYR